MKAQRTTFAIFCIAAVLATQHVCFASSVQWYNSFEKACEVAKEENKTILANFTGSDWCQYCIKTEKEIFSTDKFAKFAKENLVLLMVDFPAKKTLSEKQGQLNKYLASRYKVAYFPTHLLLDFDGEVLGKLGYVEGGPSSWVEQCKKLIEMVPRPKKVIFQKDLDKTIEKAKQHKTPVLMLVFDDSTNAGKQNIECLSSDQEFAILNGWKFQSLALDKSKFLQNTSFFGDKLSEQDISGNCNCFLIDASSYELKYKVKLGEKTCESVVDELEAVLDMHYDGSWINDYYRARFIANHTSKPILLKFTGSDWCSWCKKMDKDVFHKDKFVNFAKKNLVLLELDFPMGQKLPEDIKQQNEWLSSKFAVKGFPTVVLLDPKGEELIRGNYYSGSADEFIGEIQSVIQ